MSVSELRLHAKGQAETRNEAIKTLTLTITPKIGEASYAEKTPEHAELGRVITAVNAMADAKESLARTTAQGETVVEGETSLADAKAALDCMKKACVQADAALAHEATEMPLCKKQLMRVGSIVSKVEMRAAAGSRRRGHQPQGDQGGCRAARHRHQGGDDLWHRLVGGVPHV